MKYIDIARENTLIIEKGSYTVQGVEISLGSHDSLRKAALCTPEYTQESVDLALSAIEQAGDTIAAVEVNAMDTFGALRALPAYRTVALNFANAYHPGGGYLEGSPAQEESLCRCSTLYASLCGSDAAPLYAYNHAHRTPEGSDYVLLSPEVTVFREVPDLELIPAPYKASVISYAAPNLYGEAHALSGEALEHIFRRKIRNVFAVAWRYGYDAIVLGAWGCGAFGNDAEDVARLYHDVIHREGFGTLFKKIVFAVYSPSAASPSYNYRCFSECFR